MSQLEDQEFYLNRTIDEAVRVMEEMKELRREITEWRKSLTKKEVAMIARCDEMQKLAGDTLGKLRGDTDEARTVLGHIQGHKKWKDAVAGIWGEEGLRECFAWMQGTWVKS